MLSNRDGSSSDEIEVLTAVIERYERQNFMIGAPTPVAAIKVRMEQAGLTPRHLEPFIGSRARVSEVLGGKRTLSLDMIRSLHEGLGIPYASLIDKPEVNEPEAISVSLPVLKRLQAIGMSITADRVGDFLREAFGDHTPALLARRTRTHRASAKTDDAALLLWQATVLVQAAKLSVDAPFDRKQLTNRFLRQVAKLSALSDGPARVRELLAQYGIIFLITPTLPGTFLDGAAMLLHAKTPVITLTLRYDRVDNFWFTLLHELIHIARHYDALLVDQFAFFDDLDLMTEDELENEADHLAQESLIPSNIVKDVNWHAYSANKDILSLAEAAGVHVSIAAGRWQKDHSDYRKFSRLIERNTIRRSIAKGLFNEE
jgi:HTH-type transcriptional regulator / antitoxin HigA